MTDDPFTWYVITDHANRPLDEGERVEEDAIRARVEEITQRPGTSYFVSKLNRNKPRIYIAGRGGEGICVTQVWKFDSKVS